MTTNLSQILRDNQALDQFCARRGIHFRRCNGHVAKMGALGPWVGFENRKALSFGAVIKRFCTLQNTHQRPSTRAHLPPLPPRATHQKSHSAPGVGSESLPPPSKFHSFPGQDFDALRPCSAPPPAFAINAADASLPLLLPSPTNANKGCVALVGTEFLRDPACGDVADDIANILDSALAIRRDCSKVTSPTSLIPPCPFAETGDAVGPCESRLDSTAKTGALKYPSLKLSMYTGARPM
jgi:hypothetical protein